VPFEQVADELFCRFTQTAEDGELKIDAEGLRARLPESTLTPWLQLAANTRAGGPLADQVNSTLAGSRRTARSCSSARAGKTTPLRRAHGGAAEGARQTTRRSGEGR